MELTSSIKRYSKDSFHTTEPSKTVERAKIGLRRFGKGIFYGLQDVGKADTLGIPIFKVLGSSRFNEWGKGITREQCEASAIMERVERVSSVPAYRNDLSTLTSSFNDLKKDAISRKDLGLINAHHVLYRNQEIHSCPAGFFHVKNSYFLR